MKFHLIPHNFLSRFSLSLMFCMNLHPINFLMCLRDTPLSVYIFVLPFCHFHFCTHRVVWLHLSACNFQLFFFWWWKSVHERLMRFTRVACKLFFPICSFTSPILWLIKKTFVNGRILDSKICNYEMLFAHTKSSPQHSFSLARSLWKKICKHVLTQRVITREIDMNMRKGRKINERKFQLTSLSLGRERETHWKIYTDEYERKPEILNLWWMELH